MRSVLRASARILTAAALLATSPALAVDTDAADANPTAESLADMDLESLMNLDVTSVSKREGKLGSSPAAIFVITGDDIRRSGVRSIPEALRMAPGVEVAQIDANKWAITIRGFNDQYANKLLVLMDGRSVYTPDFAGVLWDVQDTMLEDIDRIEVIRGPGATLWGANAVNGVINIITKKARDTQGLLLSGGYGNEERGFAEGRYGFAVNDKIHVRAYGKGFDRDSFWDGRRDSHGGDEWDQIRGGFRADLDAGATLATVQGDIYHGHSGDRIHEVTSLRPLVLSGFDADARVAGGNLLTRFTHDFSEDSTAQLQLYYDRTNRQEATSSAVRDTFDVDFQHDWTLADWYRVLWGVDYRYSKSRTDGSLAVDLADPDRVSQFVAGFLNNELTVTEGLTLYLGAMGEYNNYTGWELQPSGRVAWTPNAQHTVWGAVSRAVRTPSQADDDARAWLDQVVAIPIDIPPPFGPMTVNVTGVPRGSGQRDFKSENEASYELGYRFFPTSVVSLDATIYYNTYDDLRSSEFGAPATSDIIDAVIAQLLLGQSWAVPLPLTLENRLDGHTYGAELAAQWQVAKPWKLGLTYSYFRMHLEPDKSSNDTTSAYRTSRSSPTNMIGLTSYLDLPYRLEWDASVKYTDNLASQRVGSYVRLDTRVAWRPIESLELALVGLNLLDGKHEEFGDAPLFNATKVQRSYYAQATWRW
jgi:iron complex outermembrane receptor protein